ncbi:MAG: endonuclease/exonuclease/phosphatase family protein [Anaerolineales bacterium]|nr:MAG: endonuclease/exonuclease/phosphatase family protein [Anaerolineales bacterium]
MNRSLNPARPSLPELLFYGILFLFFFQLIADFVEAIYAFGLLGTSIPPEIVSVLFLFSPLVLILLRRKIPFWWLMLAGELVFLTRVAETFLDTRGRMLVSGLGVSAFLILLPGILWKWGRAQRTNSYPALGGGLALAVGGSILLRVLGSGSDISTLEAYQAIGWGLALLGGLLLPITLRQLGDAGDMAGKTSSSFGRLVGLSLGMLAILTLLYFAFTSINVIARWSGANYLLVMGLAVLAQVGFVGLILGKFFIWNRQSTGVLLFWNGLFVLALVLTILMHQISFPSNPVEYPYYAPDPGWLAYLPLVLMLLLYPILLVDFSLITHEITRLRPTPRAFGGAFSLAALFLLVMIFAHVFTTVYDYIPVVGPFFRDKFWLVHLAVGLVLVLAMLFVRPKEVPPAQDTLVPWVGATLLGLSAFLVVWQYTPLPDQPSPGATHLRVLTYNIQQGYSEEGLKNFDGQLELIKAQLPDLIGLQESDTNRIAGGNSDVVRYFADRLEMHSYYGPKTVTGTFGIALLSRYPIQNPRTFYMYSEGEQTATIWAQIQVDSRTFNVFVTHLGNGGPIVQQQAILREVQGVENVILMGDFNFRPDTDQYRITTDLLDDAWLLRWPTGSEALGLKPDQRIDHVFVSPGTQVLYASYLLIPESDHPLEVVEIGW